jgi:hypothetical protein
VTRSFTFDFFFIFYFLFLFFVVDIWLLERCFLMVHLGNVAEGMCFLHVVFPLLLITKYKGQ